MITQARLKELLRYDATTGDFQRADGGSAPLGVVNNYGYLKLHIGGISIYAHRAAWLYVTGELPDTPIDHMNRSRLDNRFENLRLCSIRENVRHQGRHADKVTSRFKGVDWVAHRHRWRARIVVARKRIHLGAHFTVEETAARAYDKAALALFGEFALTNKMLGLYEDR